MEKSDPEWRATAWCLLGPAVFSKVMPRAMKPLPETAAYINIINRKGQLLLVLIKGFKNVFLENNIIKERQREIERETFKLVKRIKGTMKRERLMMQVVNK